ncbi:MAG: 1-acyl-sn-glycerol-3-phosphate acyltransferase [Chloroflexota bacterium]
MGNFSVFSKKFWKLTQVLLDTTVEAFRFKNLFINAFIRSTSIVPNLRVSLLGRGFEERIAQHKSVKPAGEWLLSKYSQECLIEGAERIPETGPLLVVCNHSGMGDALGVYASLPRTDVYTVVLRQGILKGLPQFEEFCVVIDQEKPALALKQMVGCLREGNTILMFPRGKIEDDPGLDAVSAQATVAEWSESIALLARRVPNLVVLTVAVGGVISRQALNNPIVHFYGQQEHRSFLAATLQLMFPVYRDPIASVVYGSPLRGEEVTMANVRTEMRRILRHVYDQQQDLVAAGRLSRIPQHSEVFERINDANSLSQ